MISMGGRPSEGVTEPFVPEVVQWLSTRDITSQSLVGFARGEMTFTNGIGFVKRLYGDAEVRAVCKEEYWGRIVKEQAEVLRTGHTIQRVVVVQNHDSARRFATTHDKLLKSLNDAGVKVIIAYGEILGTEFDGFRAWDFALVKFGECCVVAVTDVNHPLDGRAIEGRVSWRAHELKFYESLWRRIVDSAHAKVWTNYVGPT